MIIVFSQLVMQLLEVALEETYLQAELASLLLFADQVQLVQRSLVDGLQRLGIASDFVLLKIVVSYVQSHSNKIYYVRILRNVCSLSPWAPLLLGKG